VTLICPKCKSTATAVRHCSTPTCDLIGCTACHGFGTKDGHLWRQEHPSEA
jgi:hypothetical protein